MSVLSVVQEFCGKKTLPVPTAVVGSTDKGVIQIKYLLDEALRELSEYRWQEQKIEKTFVATGVQSQGALTSIIGADFRRIIPGTMWNTTTDQPIIGPMSDTEWATAATFPASGPLHRWKTIGNLLLIESPPTAGDSIYLMYESSNAFASSAGVPKAAITVDSDLFLIPEIIVHRSLDYRWKRQKGEPWETDYNEYMALLPKKLMDTQGETLSLDTPSAGIRPGIWVPAGSW